MKKLRQRREKRLSLCNLLQQILCKNNNHLLIRGRDMLRKAVSMLMGINQLEIYSMMMMSCRMLLHYYPDNSCQQMAQDRANVALRLMRT
jgi:hypothetical protein